ncbi:MAG TPA: hypothetical protein VG095_08320, partial [Chthoniobacterales bacterium]|nr:hypothetical protein [Chthoniobacterales bacterium]
MTDLRVLIAKREKVGARQAQHRHRRAATNGSVARPAFTERCLAEDIARPKRGQRDLIPVLVRL